MDVSSNKPNFINLKGTEALSGISTRFTDNENFNNFEKILETGVYKIFNSMKSKDENSVDILINSFIGKKTNRSKSPKSENSNISNFEDEKSKGILDETNSNNNDFSNNYDINNNMDMNNIDEFPLNNNEILDYNSNLINNFDLTNNLINNQNINQNLINNQNVNLDLVNNQNINRDLVNNQNINHDMVNNQNINQNLTNNQNINYNITNKTIKNQENIRVDNTIKEVIKKPMNIVKKVIEGIINKKFYLVNLDDIIGSCLKQNRVALELHIYEILYYNEDNKKILLEAEVNLSEKDREIYIYFITRKLKFIFEKYTKNEKEFVINNKKIRINEFKTLDEVIREKKEKNYTNKTINKNDNNKNDNNKNENNEKKGKTYNKNYSEQKIDFFEKLSKNFLLHINDGYLSERKSRINKIFFIYKTIKKFDDIIKKENENDNTSC